jgi:CTP:molybdopterin cytidylyltransferase MocA
MLSSKLHKAAGTARRFGQKKALLDVEDAEELVQLLEDSLRSARELIATTGRYDS